MPRRSVVALSLAGLALALWPQPRAAVSLAAFSGSYTWRMDDPAFGGLSGLELASDGLGFAAVTDRGSVLTGRLQRDAQGVIVGIQAARLDPLRDGGGLPVRGLGADPEGLAQADDGRLFVSFEADHRIRSYAAPGAAAEALPPHADFAALQPNSGMEALAIDALGRLYTLPERSGRRDRPFPVYRFDGAWSTPFQLPRDGDFLPVGADIGPDGRLYLLERDFRGLLGFYARVSRFEIGEDRAGPREVLYETRLPFQNNFEAIAVWRDASGAIRFTLLSDDNFTGVLTTEFADYRLPH